MYKVISDKPPISSSSDTNVAGSKPATASASFQERTVSTAGPEQSASFLPSGDVQQHSPIPPSIRRPSGPKRFAIVEGSSMSAYEQVSKLRTGPQKPASGSNYSSLEFDSEQQPEGATQSTEKPQSVRLGSDEYSSLEFDSEQQPEGATQSAEKPQSVRPKTLEYDYPYTEIKLKPRPGSSEYSKLKHDRGKLDPEPKPIVKPEDPWLPGSKQNVRRQRYSSIPLELGKRGKRADQLAKMQENPETEMEDYVDMSAQTNPRQQDVSAAKQRMATPPPPERPPKASVEPEQPLTPPPIPKRPPKSSPSSDVSPPTLPPRPSRSSAPPSLYTRTDKPSEPPPLPPRTNQSAPKPQSQDVRQQTAATSKPDVHDESKKTES